MTIHHDKLAYGRLARTSEELSERKIADMLREFNKEKKGLILTNPYSALPAAQYQSARLKEELENLGVRAEIKGNDLDLRITEKGEISNGEGAYDFCVYLDKDKYAARMLEKSGLRLFNRAEAVEICDDKMLTHIALANNGIPMPKTLGGLLCYSPQERVKQSTLDKIEKELGYPVIIKESYGSLGKGVYKADNRKELSAICERVKCGAHLFQEFVANSAGRDIRVIVIGGKCVAAMQRKSLTDFRSNIELGGEGAPYEIDAKLNDICVRTAEILGLDYCGIDILFGDDGYLLCEVNSNAFFGGIEKYARANIARAYAECIVKEIYG